MRVLLNGGSQNVPGEELEGNIPLLGHVEQRHRVDDLILGHDQVDDSEVLLEAVTDEDDAAADQIAQLQVTRLQRRQMLARNVGVQVSGLDARKFRQIIHHLITKEIVSEDAGEESKKNDTFA